MTGPDRPNRLLIAVLAVMIAASLTALILMPHHRPSSTTITEDDPRWNCHTMGNHVCGPVTP